MRLGQPGAVVLDINAKSHTGAALRPILHFGILSRFVHARGALVCRALRFYKDLPLSGQISRSRDERGESAHVPTAIDHQTAEEAELARLLVETLHLDIPPESIDPVMPLFGDELGLDSIDALELALAISRAYGVEIKSDDARNKEIFASLRSLAGYIAEHRTR
ncbi:MAG: hypothetical protein IRZ23_07965 [Acetobacteraceae bacterium]|nr:hypothetical protein [Methyloceanibacter sp.]MBX5472382.1 hypothetical protein [Acetobacteraceae bacterium]